LEKFSPFSTPLQQLSNDISDNTTFMNNTALAAKFALKDVSKSVSHVQKIDIGKKYKYGIPEHQKPLKSVAANGIEQASNKKSKEGWDFDENEFLNIDDNMAEKAKLRTVLKTLLISMMVGILMMSK